MQFFCVVLYIKVDNICIDVWSEAFAFLLEAVPNGFDDDGDSICGVGYATQVFIRMSKRFVDVGVWLVIF